jgi:hypothetical protein
MGESQQHLLEEKEKEEETTDDELRRVQLRRMETMQWKSAHCTLSLSLYSR